jgi:2-amino-4-hydroxy-6-hydroxymethyldihydropteridine diphosphokinase
VTDAQPVEVGLGLGSNQGDRRVNLIAAKKAVSEIPGVTLLAQSSLYETEPVGVKPEYQHLKFINAVLVVRCDCTLAEFHQSLLKIEKDIGRQRTADQFAPRPLDIDILFAGSQVLQTSTLKLPHPQCLKRRFVLEPLAEIRPDMVLPTSHMTVRDLLAGLPVGEPVFKLPDSW